jgi:hypothetical protein
VISGASTIDTDWRLVSTFMSERSPLTAGVSTLCLERRLPTAKVSSLLVECRLTSAGVSTLCLERRLLTAGVSTFLGERRLTSAGVSTLCLERRLPTAGVSTFLVERGLVPLAFLGLFALPVMLWSFGWQRQMLRFARSGLVGLVCAAQCLFSRMIMSSLPHNTSLNTYLPTALD